MKHTLGLDKLQFLIPTGEMRFGSDFQATVSTAFDAATGEAKRERVLWRSGDREVSGLKAYLNTDNLHLSIEGAKDGSESLCRVHFSAGAYADNNLQPLTLEQTLRVAREAREELLSLGAEVDLERAMITRMDIARNVALSHPVACYSPCFTALGTRKRVDKADFGGTGFLMGNKTWEIGFYDKAAEMVEKGHAPEQCPVNTLRPELRLKKARAIRDAVGCDRLADLPSVWDNLSAAYRSGLERDVFRARPEAAIDRSLNQYEMAEHVREGARVRKWQALKNLGYSLVLVRDFGLEGAKQFVQDCLGYDITNESDQRQLRRIYKELEDADFAIKNAGYTDSEMPVRELYKELKRQVMNF